MSRRWFKSRCRQLLGSVWVLLCFTCPLAQAAGVRDLGDGWLIGPAAVAEFLGQPAKAANGLWVTAGQSRLFGMPELPIVALELGVRLAKWPGQPTIAASWQALGRGLYREDERRAHLQLGRVPAVGIALRSVAVSTGGEAGIPSASQRSWQAALTVQGGWRPGPADRIQARIWLTVAGDERLRDAEARRPLIQIQGWSGPVAWAVSVDQQSDQTPVVGLEWDLAWGGGACGLRLEPSTGTMGPVINWRRGSLLVRTSHLVHPLLGVTHRLQLGAGSWGAPRW